MLKLISRNAFLLFVLMFVNFTIQAINIRAVAQERWVYIAVTDAAILIANFTMIQQVAKATTRLEQVWYTIGGTTGALFGVWVSRHWS